MIYEFKSRATGNLVMTQAIAERLLEIIGKTGGAKGIITVDSMAAAISSLDAAVASEKSMASAAGSASTDVHEEDPAKQISLAQRAFPFIEMLKRAFAAQKDITWGV